MIILPVLSGINYLDHLEEYLNKWWCRKNND